MSRSDDERPVEVVLFGLGTVGRAALRLCLTRRWLRPVGAVVGLSVPVAKQIESDGIPADLLFSTDPDHLLDRIRPDVALVATRSPIAEVKDDVPQVCTPGNQRGRHQRGARLSPRSPIPTRAEEIAAACLRSGASVVATGINPSFVFDVLPVVVAAACWNVDRISVTRALDASVFGQRVHRSLGVGYSPSDFEAARRQGIIRGHIGFAESAHVIAGVMGKRLDRFEENIQPLIADRSYQLAEYLITPGRTAGVVQSATGWVAGRPWLRFDLSLHVDPALGRFGDPRSHSD